MTSFPMTAPRFNLPPSERTPFPSALRRGMNHPSAIAPLVKPMPGRSAKTNSSTGHEPTTPQLAWTRQPYLPHLGERCSGRGSAGQGWSNQMPDRLNHQRLAAKMGQSVPAGCQAAQPGIRPEPRLRLVKPGKTKMRRQSPSIAVRCDILVDHHPKTNSSPFRADIFPPPETCAPVKPSKTR